MRSVDEIKICWLSAAKVGDLGLGRSAPGQIGGGLAFAALVSGANGAGHGADQENRCGDRNPQADT